MTISRGENSRKKDSWGSGHLSC